MATTKRAASEIEKNINMFKENREEENTIAPATKPSNKSNNLTATEPTKEPVTDPVKELKETIGPAKTGTEVFKEHKNGRARGVQKTIYFEKEVYDFVEEIRNKYDFKLNEVINIIIKQYMK